LSETVDDLLLTALDRDPSRRFASARALALALEAAERPASPAEIAETIERMLGAETAARLRQAADARDWLADDDAVTLPNGPDCVMELHAGELTRTPRVARRSDRPIPPAAGEPTRTETVQRAAPFALAPPPPEEASGSTHALSLPPARKRRRLLPAVASAAVLLAGAGWLAKRSSPPVAELRPITAAAALAVEEWNAQIPTEEIESALADAEPTAQPTPAPRRARPAAWHAKPPKKVSCKELTYEDSSGIRRVKRQCL
jgi:hypothetical protein